MLCIQWIQYLCHIIRYIINHSHPLLAVHPWKGHLKSTSLSFFFSKKEVVITLEGHCGDLNKIYKVTRAMSSTQQNRNCCKGWWAWPYFAHLEVELDHLWVWWWCYHAGFEWEFHLSLCYWPTGGAWSKIGVLWRSPSLFLTVVIWNRMKQYPLTPQERETQSRYLLRRKLW